MAQSLVQEGTRIMEELLKIVLLFAVGSIAGFMNVMAGGGSTITLPTLIFLGLHSSLANGTNRIALLFQNFSGIISFKQEKYHHFKMSLWLAVFTLPGAIAGAVLATRISDELFQKILACVLIGVIVTILLPKPNHGKQQIKEQQTRSWLIYPAMFGLGFYGGFVQAGVGFLFMAALYHLMRLDLVQVNMHKVFIIFVYTIPALVVFFLTHNVDLKLGLVLAAGNAFGGWWSAKFSVRKGERFIRIILVVAILIMSLKLLNII
jgi:uncharacterized membrane protein YfcA